MIRAVVWKELREQGLIGATLVVLGSGVMAAAATLASPPATAAPATDVVRHLGVGLLAALMLCVTAGTVCGGAVFAAEREAGTMGFLDALPASRRRLWGAKVVAGLGLAVPQVAVLVGVAAALGLIPSPGWARAIGLFSLLAFAWGLFGSTVSRTTLGSVGVAIAGGSAAAVLILLPILVFGRPPRPNSIRPTEAAVFLAAMFALPLVLSAWVFTAPDRLRTADEAAAGARAGVRPRFGFRALVWLTVRQFRFTGSVLAGFALFFGLSLLAPAAQPALSWPALALTAGVLTGVTAFADEQTRGAARFWGEQRLPVGRAWAVKIGLHLLFCLGLLVVLLLPMALRNQFSDRDSLRGHTWLALTFRSTLFDELGSQAWKYLLAPAVYGFAAGHLCGLVFRKLVVACGVAGIVGGVGAAAWGPSLLAGGVYRWQVWLPPAVVLVTARLLVPAWAADRVATRRSLGTLAGGFAACLLVVGAGIACRVLEVPDRPDGEADIAYAAGLVPRELNSGGNDYRIAADRYTRTVTQLVAESERPAGANAAVPPRSRVEQRLADVAVRGWPDDDRELGAWLDRLFNPPAETVAPRAGAEIAAGMRAAEPPSEVWHSLAARATAYPVGVFEYPLLSVGTWRRDGTVSGAQRMALALLAQGLRQQAAGDSVSFFLAFRTVVTLSRTMRNGSFIDSFLTGVRVEQAALAALDRWLERLPARPGPVQALLAAVPATSAAAAALDPPEMLRAMTALLEADDPRGPFDPTPHFLAERHLMRESLQAPTEWLPRTLNYRNLHPPDLVPPEVELVALAWAVPWERERTRRLVGLGFEKGPSEEVALLTGRPGAGFLIRPKVPAELVETERALRGQARAAILKLALRAYLLRNGMYPDPARPDPLAVLVEGGYLRRVPPDPYDETRPFGYRLAPPGGEVLRPRRPATTTPPGGTPTAPIKIDIPPLVVPAGQPIIWSVGADRADQGGTQLPADASPGGPVPEDLIFLVPLPPKP
jgi:hypothetical protein